MSRFAEQSPERQIPWLPGERFELALDSREGAINASTAGSDTLTVTTHRVIRLGGSGGAKNTEVAPLDRLSAVQVLDISRDNGKLTNGLIVLGVGVVLAWLTWVLFDGVMLFSLIAGGLPMLIAIYMLTGWLFPDEEGALLLHTAGGHVVRQALLSEQSRHDAYLVAHRIYELMAKGGAGAPPPTAPASDPSQAVQSPAYLGGAPAPSAMSSVNGAGASPEVAALLTAALTEDHTTVVSDVAERIARSIEKTSAATSYATHQTLRDPGHERNAPGDYVWDMEFVAPDRYRVSQTGWSDSGEVHERWTIVGNDFYRDAAGSWRRSEDPRRFTAEQALTKHLSPEKYLAILRQGFPSQHAVDVGGGRRYLRVSYESLTREALAAILANPSPPQGVTGSADVWIDLETDLLAKAEVNVAQRDSDRKLVFEQAFASYNATLDVAAPVVAAGQS